MVFLNTGVRSKEKILVLTSPPQHYTIRLLQYGKGKKQKVYRLGKRKLSYLFLKMKQLYLLNVNHKDLIDSN